MKSKIANLQNEVVPFLIKSLEIDQLSEEKQNEFTAKITAVLQEKIFLTIMEKLGENGREEYERMMNGEIIQEQVEAFFREKIYNYDEIIEQAVKLFQEEMMSK